MVHTFANTYKIGNNTIQILIVVVQIQFCSSTKTFQNAIKYQIDYKRLTSH